MAGLTVVSGGQTGVDRAALDAAIAAGLPCGGWCPRGRVAEDGRIPQRYPLREAARAEPDVRTRMNVRDSDATLIITRGAPSGGTALTVRAARNRGRGLLIVDFATAETDAVRAARIVRWLRTERVSVLNVAGPRESGAPGIYAETRSLLARVFIALARPRS